MSKPLVIDFAEIDAEDGGRSWLDPAHPMYDAKRKEAIRKKHRDRRLAEQAAKRASNKD